MTKEQLGSLILDSERQLYSTAKTILFSDHDCADVVDEHAHGVGLADDAGELAHGLAHQTGLQAHMAVAHLALDLGTGHHGCHRVHHDGVDGTGAHQRFADLHGLLTGV